MPGSQTAETISVESKGPKNFRDAFNEAYTKSLKKLKITPVICDDKFEVIGKITEEVKDPETGDSRIVTTEIIKELKDLEVEISEAVSKKISAITCEAFDYIKTSNYKALVKLASESDKLVIIEDLLKNGISVKNGTITLKSSDDKNLEDKIISLHEKMPILTYVALNNLPPKNDHKSENDHTPDNVYKTMETILILSKCTDFELYYQINVSFKNAIICKNYENAFNILENYNHLFLQDYSEDEQKKYVAKLINSPTADKETVMHILAENIYRSGLPITDEDKKYFFDLIEFGGDPTLKDHLGVSALDMVSSVRDKLDYKNKHLEYQKENNLLPSVSR
jgi:hypothetical protein